MRSIRSLSRIKLTGEGDPAEQPQTLTTRISLFNLLRVGEKKELANLEDRSRLGVSDIVDAALTLYFESLPESERRVIDGNARSSIGFLLETEEIRAGMAPSATAPESQIP